MPAADAGRITAQIDGDISGLKSALGQARSEATSAVSGIEGSFKSGLGAGLRDSMSGIASSMGPVGSALSAIGPAGIVAGAGIAVIGGALSSSVQAAASFETSMSGVAKTTGLAGPELSALSSSLLEMSSSMPVAASELANIAQVAGSLGVAKEEIAGFTEVAAQMAVAFDMPAEQAATAAAKILTAFQMDIDTGNMENLGNVVNSMGDNFAATETEVLDFTNRASYLNTTFGLSIPQVAAWGTALISAGMSAETASTGIKSLMNMSLDPKKFEAFAQAAGMSAEELKQSLNEDVMGTYAKVAESIAGSSDAVTKFQTVSELAGTEGMTALLKMASSGDTLQAALQKANSEWENGSSMMKTFEQNSSTLNSQWDIFTNTMTRAGIELGNVLLPGLTEGVKLLNYLALGAIEAGEAIYDMLGGLSDGLEDTIGVDSGLNKWVNDLLGVDTGAAEDAGGLLASQCAGGFKEADAMDDLAEAPGEALGSPEALAGAGAAGAAVAEEFSKEWVEAFQKAQGSRDVAKMLARQATAGQEEGDLTKNKGNTSGWVTTSLENGLAVEVAYQGNDDSIMSRLFINGQQIGDAVYGANREESLRALLDASGMAYNEANVLDLTDRPGSAAIWRASQTADIVLDSFLDVTSSTKSEVEAAGQEIADAFADGMVPDKALIDSKLESLRNLQLYDPENAKAQGSENAIYYLDALSDAIEAYDEAKAKYLVEPDNDRAKADLERTRANLQAQLNANPLKATITTNWGQFDTKSLSDIIFDPAAMNAAAAVPEKFFMGTIVPGIQSGMEEAKAALATGQITEADVYDAFIKPLESVTEYLPGWLDNLNTLFRNGFIDFDQYSNDFDKFLGIYSKADAVLNNNVQATQAATVGYNQLQKAIEDCEACVMSDFGAWQEQQENLFNPSYIGAGGQAYLDWKNTVVSAANEAAMAVQAVGGKALGSAATPQSIPVSVTLDTSKATAALSEFEGTAKKDVQKPLTIDSTAATASITEIDTAAKQSASKPVIIDSSQAMSAIAAINSAASAPVYKTVYVNEVYTGSSGGSGGGGGGGSGSLGNYQLPPIFMARGGYVDRPTLAVVGESGPEYVIPAERMARAVSGGGGINITINSPITGGGSDMEALLEQRNRELVAEITEQIAAARRGM